MKERWKEVKMERSKDGMKERWNNGDDELQT